MEERWIAYCAGFFEGEGCVSFWANEWRNITLYIEQTNIAPLEIFEETFETGIIRGPKKRYIKNRKDYWTYNIHKLSEIDRVMNLMSPYLTPEKMEQYKIAREKYETWRK